jgi:hypothetical protein
MEFLIIWLASCAVVFGAVVCAVNYDIVAVFFLRLVNAPVYLEARRIAGLIYQHPEQWTVSAYTFKHPAIGQISHASLPEILDLDGEGFGHWKPTAIERRIIADAARWYRRVYIRSLVGAALERTP